MTTIKTSGGIEVEFRNELAVSPVDRITEGHSILEHLQSHSVEVGGLDSPIYSAEVLEAFYAKERKGSLSSHEILQIGGIQFTQEGGQPEQPATRPDNFIYPQAGPAGAAVARIARALKYGRSIYLYGPAGTGKSDLFRALSADLNMEFSLYPMREDLDPALYLGQMTVVIDAETGQNKTEFQEGALLRDLQGRVGKDGVLRPVMILIDDIDRAPPTYAELFRHILDGSQSVFIPELSRSVSIHPDTQVVATANSRGQGDDYGRYASVQMMDDSILDRFHRFVEYHWLEEEEEKSILAAKFPLVAQKAPDALSSIMKATTNLRDIAAQDLVPISFSHRRVADWMRSLEEFILEEGEYRPEMRWESAQDWLERFDIDTRKAVVERGIGVHIDRKSYDGETAQ